jgi:hypothetical protein
MNGAILISQFLQTGNWEYAIEKLQSFWIDKKKGLASTPSQAEIEKFTVIINKSEPYTLLVPYLPIR